MASSISNCHIEVHEFAVASDVEECGCLVLERI
jgi:hypothetical protein